MAVEKLAGTAGNLSDGLDFVEALCVM